MFCLFFMLRARCESRGRDASCGTCHLRPGGNGFVQQQAQTEAGPPQPGNGRTHVTPHTGRRIPKRRDTHILYTLCHTCGCVHGGVHSHQTLQCSRVRFTLLCVTTAETAIVNARARAHTHTLNVLRASLAFTGRVGKLLNSPLRAREELALLARVATFYLI